MRCLAMGLLATIVAMSSSQAALISEFEPNPPGSDPANVNFELSGDANSSFSYWILSIEDDGDSGLVDRAASVSGTFDSNGLAVVSVGDLENPSFTVMLVDTFTGMVGTSDIDDDNDGVVDTTFWNTVEDALGVPDDGSEALYASQLGGVDFAYSGDEPQLMFREGSTGAWFAINDPAGTEAYAEDGSTVSFASFSTDPSVTTFGAINPTAVPEPGSLLALTLCGGVVARRIRRRQR
ncbi:PEP-CTERM sorting domain-containing protein [Crateriforma spongiae]|uniref:PEP-CTERM sorting domain-containing protein n=1 Tax=Crateriforma spongiae TaxID=2724528 RepID=UPI0039AF0333